jgi:hypothetical protein
MNAWLIRLTGTITATAPAWSVPLVTAFSLWETDDGSPHLFRALAYHLAQRVPWDLPRWTPDFFLGFGYPVFNYYSPLTYVAASLLVWVGIPLIGAYTLLGIVAVVVGAVGAGVAVDSLWPSQDVNAGASNRHAAWVLAGTTYALAPYPFLVNLYVRGDLPEAWGLAILPWFLLAVHRAYHTSTADQRIRSIQTASALGIALVLIHALSAAMAAGCAAILLSAALVLNAPFARRGVTTLAVAGAVVAGATAFSTLPMLLERDLVQVDVIKFPSSNMVQSLAAPFGFGHLLIKPERSPYGSGLSAIDWTFSVRYPWGPPGWDGPVKVGAVQAGILATALAALAWARTRAPVVDPALAASAAIAAACWFLNVNWSSAIWEHVDVMRWLQFPSRLWGPFSLAVALLAGRAILALSIQRQWAIGVVAIMVVALSSSSLRRLPIPETEKPVVAASPEALVAAEYARDTWAGRVTSSGEFTPRSADFAVRVKEAEDRAGLIGRPAGNHVLDWTYPPASWLGGSVLVYRGEAEITALRGAGSSIELAIDASEGGATIAFHQLSFPGFRATVDGAASPISIPPYRADEDALLGVQLVDVPQGKHKVAIGFGATPLRLAADAVSVAVLLAVALAPGYRSWLDSPSRRRTASYDDLRQAQSKLSPISKTWLSAASVIAWLLGSEIWSTLEPAPVVNRANRLVADVASAVRNGTARLDSPTGVRLGPDAFLDLGWQQVGASDMAGGSIDGSAHAGRLRQWLFMHPPARVSFSFDAPLRDAYFQSGLALRPDAWKTDYGDGVTFVVEVGLSDTTGGAPLSSCRLRLNPRAHSDEHKWVDVRVPLDVVAGKRATITLRTEPVADVRNDWAGWGNPAVVIDHSIRRPANGPRPPASAAPFPTTGCELL